MISYLNITFLAFSVIKGTQIKDGLLQFGRFHYFTQKNIHFVQLSYHIRDSLRELFDY